MKRSERFAEALMGEAVQRVIVRRDRESRELVAVLPDAPTNPGNVLTYMHCGQHSEAHRNYIREKTVAAGNGEAVDKLLAELCSLGYELRVVKRMPPFNEKHPYRRKRVRREK